MEDSESWFYDSIEGCIRNQTRSFFSIHGLEYRIADGRSIQQPVLLQQEIGYLGIICKEFDGVMYFLMQAKIEPGNINKVQLSPTIQATKSNFTQQHGGSKPPYLDFFLNAEKYEIVVDQIQSEQSSRFYKKRNRNIIIRVDEDVPLLSSHRWMTLGQIKRLMREENLVNMDTRTVLSCIPFSFLPQSANSFTSLEKHFSDAALFHSIFDRPTSPTLPQIYRHINNFKMFSDSSARLIPLSELSDWEMRNGELVSNTPFPFKVIFCDISIEGREVKHWTQPLFEAAGIATFGLLCCEENGVLKFLVKATPEIGCFDLLELGPTIQQEAYSPTQHDNEISPFFFELLEKKQGIIFDQLLSEEGGRFYHEQNRNILIRIPHEQLPSLPEGYFLLDYYTLNQLTQINNILNIQLRNLLALLEA